VFQTSICPAPSTSHADLSDKLADAWVQAWHWRHLSVKFCGRSSTATVLGWNWVPNFYFDPAPSTSDGAAAARELRVLLAPAGFGRLCETCWCVLRRHHGHFKLHVIGMLCTRSSWTCSPTLPGEDLRLVRLRLGMPASLRTWLRDLLAWSSMAPRTLQCCVLLAWSARGLPGQPR
jgi:hypothetical protein